MSVLQIINLPVDAVKVRWQEPYVTQGLNQKALIHPRGVVAGFKVAPNFGYIVDVLPDPQLALSLANVLDSTSGKYLVTVIQSNTLQIDLTAQAGSTVYIVVDAQYAVGSASSAQVKVVDAAELGTNPDLVVLAKVNVPAAPPVVVADINLGYRLNAGDALQTLAKPPVNLVFNSGFEGDAVTAVPRGWTPAGAVIAESFPGGSRTGVRAMLLIITGAGTVTTAPMPVDPGSDYRVSAWLRTDGTGVSGTGVQLRLQYLDADFAPVSTTLVEAPLTGVQTSYVQRAQLLTVPAGVAHAKLSFEFDGTTSGNVFIDDVEFSTPRPDALAHSSVFSGAVADAYHSHTSAGSSYGGGPSWADGTTNPTTTVEGQLDKILTDLGGANGAKKLGLTPVFPVDLLTATRVDLGLQELDGRKASVVLSNNFSSLNTFANALTPNMPAIMATGNGTGEGIRGTGGVTGALGLWGFGTGGFAGVRGDGNAGGAGGYFVGGATSGDGVTGTGGGANGVGLRGVGTGAGSGVVGTGGAGAGAIGVMGTGGTLGPGVKGQGSGLGVGVWGVAGGSNGSSGVLGQGSGANTTGVSGTGGGTGAGGVFNGGPGGGPGVNAAGAGGNNIAYQINSITDIIAFASPKTNFLWLTPFRFSRNSTLDCSLPGSSYPRMYRTSTANVKAWSEFHLPVGAVITGAWLTVYHDPTAPVSTTINVSIRKRDVSNQSDPLSTPNDTLNTSPFPVTTNGGSNNTVALTLSATASDKTQSVEATEFMVELDWAAGGEAGASEHFTSGLVIQYQYTRVTR